MVQLAEIACDAEDWPRALRWFDAALELAPGSARVWCDRGYVLSEMGRWEAAIASYSRSASLGSDGQPFFFMAVQHLRSADLTAAAHALEAALSRSPEIALDVEGTPELDTLAQVPSVRTAIRSALQRL